MPDDFERLNRALAGRYSLRREVGRGGMATVYEAEDLKHGRPVALKVLRPEFAASLGPERFLREIRLTARLDHPHILPLLDSGGAAGLLYYVMPLVEGESLRDRLRREERLPVEEAIRIAREVADALDHAHGMGIVHRDIKPGNILLSGGHARVADFGIARALRASGQQDLTGTGLVVGTPTYMSPEQATGEPEVGAPSDLYGLACVLYEMLAGEPPHTGGTPEAILARKLRGDPPSLRVLRESVPRNVDEAVGRALARLPANRFQSCGDFSAALEGGVASRSGPIFPGPLVPGRLWTAVMGLMVAVVTGALWLWPRTSLAFQEGDMVLVADFDNRTGDPLFDGSLDAAFIISLRQSPFLNVYPRTRVSETLRRMRLETGVPLTGDLAREVALREGLPVVILPSLSRLGDQLSLGANVLDPESGEPLATHLVRVNGPDALLEGVDELVTGVRRALGESRRRIFASRKPLSAVTTSSLGALKLYSMATEHMRSGRWDDARRLFVAALEADSTFTAAEASLGMLVFEQFDREEGIRHLTTALARSDALTDVESYGLRAFYADAVEGDLEKAAALHRTLADLYPNQASPRHNLGWVLRRLGRPEEAAEQYQKALGLDPSLNLSYWGLSYLLLYQLGQVDSALALAHDRTGRDPGFIWAWDDLGWAYMGVDSLDAALKAFQEALELNPRLGLALLRTGHIHRLEGRLDEAAAAFRRALDVDPEDGGTHYRLAMVLREAGDEVGARHHLERFRQIREQGLRDQPENAYNHIDLALYHVRSGSPESARASVRRALDVDSASADIQFGLALVAGAEGRVEEALEHLEGAIRRGYRNFIWIKVHPDLEALFEDVRFRALLSRHMRRRRRRGPQPHPPAMPAPSPPWCTPRARR